MRYRSQPDIVEIQMGYNHKLPKRKSLGGWVLFARVNVVQRVDAGSRGSHVTQTNMKPVYYYYIGASIDITGSTQLTRRSEIKSYKLQTVND